MANPLVFLPGESHRQRSLMGYSPEIAKNQTQLSTHTCMHSRPLLEMSLYICDIIHIPRIPACLLYLSLSHTHTAETKIC